MKTVVYLICLGLLLPVEVESIKCYSCTPFNDYCNANLTKLVDTDDWCETGDVFKKCATIITFGKVSRTCLPACYTNYTSCCDDADFCNNEIYSGSSFAASSIMLLLSAAVTGLLLHTRN